MNPVVEEGSTPAVAAAASIETGRAGVGSVPSLARLAWLDYLKAFGIALVVVMHTQVPEVVFHWVHSFLMPMFFVLSGLLLAPSIFDETWGEFFRRRLSRLLKAYFFFGGLGVVQLTVMSQLGAERAPFVETALTRVGSVLFASGTLADGHPYQIYPIALWFFPALISGSVLAFGAMRFAGAKRWAILTGYVALALMLRGVVLPWELETGLAVAPLIVLGQILRPYASGQRKLPPVPVVFAPLLLALGWELAVLNAPTVFHVTWFGWLPIYVASAVCTSVGLTLVAMKLPRREWIARVSEATIFIFPAHEFVFWAAETVGRKVLHLSNSFMATYTFTLTQTLLALVFLTVTYRPFRRWCPWV